MLVFQNVVFVLSVKDDSVAYKSILRRQPAAIMQIPGLDLWDKAEVVRTNLAQHRKVLDESAFNNQMKVLLAKREANIPLFLSLACEELRVFGVFEKVNN